LTTNTQKYILLEDALSISSFLVFDENTKAQEKDQQYEVSSP
jgi:hypothetical protein